MENVTRETREAVERADYAELPVISLGLHSIREILDFAISKAKQVTELQVSMTKMVEGALPRMVRAFHVKFKHPVRHTPTVPSDEEVRFRLRLITEEYLELIDATFDSDASVSGSSYHAQRDLVRCALRLIVEHFPIKIDMPKFVDAQADLDYVNEGTRAVFGVNGAQIAVEVQRANMDKDPNGPDGKPVKPPGWRPPDIERVLREQGWQG